ncbi:MAG: efflux transporter outer membrane subunit [Phycisphaeraceae bacterium]|nr:efflux transporter outer membrane subunit [Phycisphaeraceae bacterium]MCP4067717.1 efflux transporter outer membrane subunit [Phycisphaeraceae bacterium]
MNPRRRLPSVLLAIVAFAGCSPHALRDTDLPDVEIPERFEAPDGPKVAAPDAWWTSFGEPALDRTMQAAFASNLGLRQAWSRLEQSNAQARIAGAFLYPEVNLDASATRTRTDPADFPANTSDRFAIGLGLTWELDLWRRIANRADAASLLARASRADAEQTALLLSGSITELWFSIQEQEQLLILFQRQIKLSRTLLDLTELRFGQGVGDGLQVLQQRSQLESVIAAIPEVRSTLETNRNQLAVLLARTPESLENDDPFEATPTLPELPAFPSLPSPRDLLERRPDLRAAHDRVAAADLEVAVAIADMLPALRLSLDGRFSGDQVSSLFDSTIASLSGAVLQPVFDADRRGAEADRRRAILQERVDGFTERFIIALREVEDAIDRERNQVELLKQVRIQVDLANRTLIASRIRFANAQIEYLDVITAIGALQDLQRREIGVQRAVLANRARLLLAIGGDWTRDLAPPTDDAPPESNQQVATDLGDSSTRNSES